MEPSPQVAGQRVCSSCGEQPGAGLHCQSCGANLLWRRRLPTRNDWERRKGRASKANGAEPRRPRYSSRELSEKLRGQQRWVRRGKLILVLTLSGMLEPDEEVTAIFRGIDSKGLSCWLVVSSHRLICVPDRPAVRAPVDERPARFYEFAEMRDLTTRTRITGKSRLYFSTTEEEQCSFLLRNRSGASELAELLGPPT